MDWLDRRAYPFSPRRITLPEGHLSVVDEGSGPTVVLVHGTPSWSFEWREVIPALASRARVVAPDHLGFGLSDKPADGDYTLAAHTRRFAAAMDALEVRECLLVVHDIGGAIALPWALANPERVRGVVLANTFLWPIEGPMAWVMRFYSTALGRWIYRVSNLSPRWLLPWAWGTHRALTPVVHGHYLGPFPAVADRHAVAAVPGELVSPRLAALWTRASELKMPIRAVWGLADPLVGADALDRWLAVWPDLPVTRVEKAGHFSGDEAPEAIVAAIDDLLEHAWTTPSPIPESRPLAS